MARFTTSAAVGAVALGLLLTGCGGDSGDDSTQHAVEPMAPSNYMSDAVLAYNLSLREGGRAFTPVHKGGKLWTGNPKAYERACGATFLLDDGSIPKLSAAPDGQPLKSVNDTDYYEWLQHHPKKWSAFNAWLADPAVINSIGPMEDNLHLGSSWREQAIGSYKLCPHRKAAGQPIHR